MFFSITIFTFTRWVENAIDERRIFSKLIEQKDVGSFNLRIYYIERQVFTEIMSVDQITNYTETSIRMGTHHRIEINDIYFEEHLDLFEQLINAELRFTRRNSRINARFYYIVENEEGKLFDVVMFGFDRNSRVWNDIVFVNGFEVEWNDVFYDFIIPFLTEHATRELRAYLGR